MLVNSFRRDFLENPKALFWIVFLFALILRVIFVFQWQQTPYGASPLLDAQVYDAWAKDIAAGHLLRGKAFYQSPLYPYFCGLLYAIFGHSMLIVGLFNALFGALTAALITAMTFTWFGPVAALASGILAATYRPFIFYTAPLMKEPMGLLLLALFVFVSYRAMTKEQTRDYVLAGLLLGLGALVRGNVLFFAPLVLLYGFVRYRVAFAKRALVFCATLVLFIAPATLHNYIVSGDFVPINYTDGFNLYIGNSPIANGTNAYPPEVSTDPVQEEMNTIWGASQAAGHPVGPSDVSAYWRGRALSYMADHPLRTLSLSFDKAMAFWNSAEKFDNYDIGFVEENFGTLLTWPLPRFALVTFLAAFGFVAALKKRREPALFLGVLVVVYMATLLLFYVTDRYRLPVVVLLLPLAGAALPTAVELGKGKAYKSFSLAMLVGLFFLMLGLKPDPHAVDLKAFNLGTLAMIYADMGRNQESIATYEKAIAVSPIEAGASAYARASYAYEALGKDVAAEETLKKAMDLFPKDGIVFYNYGRFLAARSRMDEALKAFERGAELSPFYLLNYYALAKGYGMRGDQTKALGFAHKGLALDPTDPLLNSVLIDLQAPFNGVK